MNHSALKILIAAASLAAFPAFADPIAANWCVSVSGDVACKDSPTNSAVDLSLFNTGTGLGRVIVTLTSGIEQFASLYLDLNLTNQPATDAGATLGTLPDGYAYLLDAPQNGAYNAFASNVLSNDNTVSAPDACCDVSMILAINLPYIAPGQRAIVFFDIGPTYPGGFALAQTSNALPSTPPVYLSGTYRREDSAPLSEVPEPAAWVLLATLLTAFHILRPGRRLACFTQAVNRASSSSSSSRISR